MGNTLAKLRGNHFAKSVICALEVTGAKVVRRNKYSDITNGASQQTTDILD